MMYKSRLLSPACSSKLRTLSVWLFIAAISIWNTPVRSDCQPDSATSQNPPPDPNDWLPQPGGTLTCSGTDTDGFERDGVDNLTIIVASGATVGGTGIRLTNSNDSTITNSGNVTLGMSIFGDQATIINNGTAGGALASGTGARFANNGTITDAVANGPGAVVFNNGTVLGVLEVRGQGGVLTNSSGALADTVQVTGGDGARVTNDGQIASGMLVQGSNVTVINNQDVIATTGFLPQGIYIEGSGTVQNNGDVSAFSPLPASNQNGISGYAEDSMTITNSGSVDASGIGIGIAIDLFAPVTASGTITNSGSVTTSGDFAPGLGLLGSGSVTNTATGTILTQGTASEGIGTDGDGVDILNENSIRTMGIDSAGIDKTGDFGKVTNDGTIQTDLGNSPGILLIGDNFTVSPTVINSDTITTDGFMSPGIAVNGLGNYVQTVAGSSITTTGDDADGIITNNVRVVENGGTIRTRGLLSDGIESVGPQILLDNLDTGIINVSGNGGTAITVNGIGAVVNNAGSITTSGLALWGVYVDGGNAIVKNEGGSITTVASGIYITGNDAIVENRAGTGGGFIQTTQSGSHGIEIQGNDAIVDNYKTIETTDDASGIAVTGDQAWLTNHSGSEINSGGAAIFLVGSPFSVDNNGELTSGLAGASDADGIHIEATGPDSMTVNNTGFIDTFGSESDGISVSASGTATINNSGFITTTDNFADGMELSGVAVYNVTSSGRIITTGDSAHGIALNRTTGSGNASITNQDEIRASGLGSAAIRLATATGNSSTVTNSATGTLMGASDAIRGGLGNETVHNYGAITGDVYLEAGNDTFLRGSSSTVSGVVSGGAGTIDKLIAELGGSQVLDGGQFVEFEELAVTGSGTLTIVNSLVIDSSVFSSGTVILDSGAVLGGNASANGGTLMGNGLITGSLTTTTGGTAAPGTSTGTLSVGGDFLLDGGVLELEANSIFDTDILDIGGDATFADGIIEVLLGFTPNPQDVLDFLVIAGTLNILQGFDGIVGVAAAGSGVALGTQFTVDLGGQLFQGTVTSVVPIPPSVWLFGSGLLGLIGIARRKKAG